MWAASVLQVSWFRCPNPGGSVWQRGVSFKRHCHWGKVEDCGWDPASARREQQSRWVKARVNSSTAWSDDKQAFHWSCRSQSGVGRLWTGCSRKQAFEPLSHSTHINLLLYSCYWTWALSDAGCLMITWGLSVPQHTLRFWLEQGVAGFAICDTDAAYSEKVKWYSTMQAVSTDSCLMIYLHFRLCWSGEVSSRNSALRRTRKGIAGGRFCSFWNEAQRWL